MQKPLGDQGFRRLGARLKTKFLSIVLDQIERARVFRSVATDSQTNIEAIDSLREGGSRCSWAPCAYRAEGERVSAREKRSGSIGGVEQGVNGSDESTAMTVSGGDTIVLGLWA